jgi:hypothetical protein
MPEHEPKRNDGEYREDKDQRVKPKPGIKDVKDNF